MRQKYTEILGVGVDNFSQENLLKAVEQKLKTKTKFYAVTPNPEIILLATKNQDLKTALNGADFAVPDGIGLKLACPSLEIIHGRKFMLKLLGLAERLKLKVFLLGGGEEVAKKAAQKLATDFRLLSIDFAPGPILDQSANPLSESERKVEDAVISQINKFKPDFLFVGFGAPKQEIWINNNLVRLNVKGAMAIGGTLDYLAGIYLLPPRWMEVLELEWLWRLLTQPWRFARIFRAVVIFPLKVLANKIWTHDNI